MTSVALTLIAGTRHSVDRDTAMGADAEPRHRIHAPASVVRQPGQVLGTIAVNPALGDQGYVGYSCDWQLPQQQEGESGL